PRSAAVPRRVPAPERREPGRRPRGVQLPVRADDRPGLLPGPARPEPTPRRPAVRALHPRPRPPGAADRLSAVPPRVRVHEPVPDGRVPSALLGEAARDPAG